MTSKNKIYRRSIPCISLAVLFFAGLGFAGEISAQTLYVKKSGTKLQAADSSRSKVIAVLSRGTPVRVVKKAKRFYQVSAGNQTGWIFKFKLSTKAPEKSSGDGDLLGALGGRQKIAARESSSGASIRGLSPISEKHAKSKGISEENIRAVKQMEAFRIDPKKMETFLKEGKLGEYGQ